MTDAAQARTCEELVVNLREENQQLRLENQELQAGTGVGIAIQPGLAEENRQLREENRRLREQVRAVKVSGPATPTAAPRQAEKAKGGTIRTRFAARALCLVFGFAALSIACSCFAFQSQGAVVADPTTPATKYGSFTGDKRSGTHAMTILAIALVGAADVHGWYADPKDEVKGFTAGFVWWAKLLAYIVVWYMATTTYAVASKHVLQGAASLTSMVMLMQLLGPALLALPQGRVLARMPRERAFLFVGAGGAFYFQSFFTLQGIRRSVNVDYVLSVKACEPLTTVFLMLMLQGSAAISRKQAASVVVAVVGLMISAGVLDVRRERLEDSPQATILITVVVLIANFCVSARNLILFAASSSATAHDANAQTSQVKMSKGHIFTTSCLFAFCIGVPVCIFISLADFTRGGASLIADDLTIAAVKWRDVLTCSTSFGLYNYCSFVVLSFVQPTMHSLLASAKRLFAVALVWIIEYRFPGKKDLAGMFLLIAGAMGVELLRPPETAEAKAAKAAAARSTVAWASSMRSVLFLAILTAFAIAPAWIEARHAYASDGILPLATIKEAVHPPDRRKHT